MTKSTRKPPIQNPTPQYGSTIGLSANDRASKGHFVSSQHEDLPERNPHHFIGNAVDFFCNGRRPAKTSDWIFLVLCKIAFPGSSLIWMDTPEIDWTWATLKVWYDLIWCVATKQHVSLLLSWTGATIYANPAYPRLRRRKSSLLWTLWNFNDFVCQTLIDELELLGHNSQLGIDATFRRFEHRSASHQTLLSPPAWSDDESGWTYYRFFGSNMRQPLFPSVCKDRQLCIVLSCITHVHQRTSATTIIVCTKRRNTRCMRTIGTNKLRSWFWPWWTMRNKDFSDGIPPQSNFLLEPSINTASPSDSTSSVQTFLKGPLSFTSWSISLFTTSTIPF